MPACTPRLLGRWSILVLALALCPLTARADKVDSTAKTAAPATKVAAPTPVKPTPPAKPAPPPDNTDLDQAKSQISQQKYDDALESLDSADKFPQNTPAMKTQIAVCRAEALLRKDDPDRDQARVIVLTLLHADPEGNVLTDAGDDIQSLIHDIRNSQPIIVHKPVTVARPNWPILFRAGISDNMPDRTVYLSLHYKPHDVTSYSTEPFRKELTSYSAILRNPVDLAPDGVNDDFFIDYYIAATDKTGKVLDTNVPPDQPIMLHVSTAASKVAELKAGIDLNLVQHPPPPPPPPPGPPPPPPWYKRWYTIAGASAVVVALTVGIAVGASQKQSLPAHIGVLNLP